MGAIFDFKQWVGFHLSTDNFREIYDFYDVIEEQKSSDLFSFELKSISCGSQYIIGSNWGNDVLLLRTENQLKYLLDYVRSNYMNDMDKESFWGLKHLIEKDES